MAERGTIVVAFDGSEHGRRAVERAIRLARAHRLGTIVLVCAHDRPPDFSRHPFTGRPLVPGTWRAQWAEQTAAQMQHEVLRIRLAGFDARATCAYDDPADLVLRVARENRAAMIVAPDDRTNALQDLVFGSLTRRLTREREIPVTLVPRLRRTA